MAAIASASEKAPNASRLAAPKASASRRRAINGGGGVGSGPRRVSHSPSARPGPARISAASSRPSRLATSPLASGCVSNNPVETSSQAAPNRAPNSTKASSRFGRPASSSASSTNVPGVTTRTTARLIGALPTRILGSSICSTTATRKPRRIRRDRYISYACAGTPHIWIGWPAWVPRCVSEISRAAAAASASAKNSS